MCEERQINPKRLDGLCDKLWIICIDEISMLRIQEFNRLGKRLKQLTQNQNEYMGNVNILFSGNFFKLKFQGTPLYDRINEAAEIKHTNEILDASSSYFENFTSCFYLDKAGGENSFTSY